MDLQQFAEKYRLTAKKDSCGEVVIPGRPRNAKRVEDRCHIFEADAGLFSLYLPMDSVGKWNNRRKAAIAAEFTLQQDGDTEGILGFDPRDSKQSELAIKLAGARGKKALSPEKLLEMSERGKRLATLRKTMVGTPL